MLTLISMSHFAGFVTFLVISLLGIKVHAASVWTAVLGIAIMLVRRTY